MQIRTAETDEDVSRCHDVMVQLRPHVTANEFVPAVRRLERTDGYRLTFLEDAGQVVAAAGFRIVEMFSRGRYVYVDDLVTDADHRSRGHGKALLDWLVEFAAENGCSRVDLDSGTERAEAHRFYRREGMGVTAVHFALEVPDSPA